MSFMKKISYGYCNRYYINAVASPNKVSLFIYPV